MQPVVIVNLLFVQKYRSPAPNPNEIFMPTGVFVRIAVVENGISTGSFHAISTFSFPVLSEDSLMLVFYIENAPNVDRIILFGAKLSAGLSIV